MASTVLTAGIILGLTFLFIFFFLLLHKGEREKQRALFQSTFDQIVTTHKLSISRKEEFNNYLIAMDETANKLVYIDFSLSKPESKVLDLRNITTVSLDSEERSIYEEKKGVSKLLEKKIATVQLILSSNKADLHTQRLPFYQLSKDGMDDVRSVQKRLGEWKKAIDAQLKQVHKPEAKAAG